MKRTNEYMENLARKWQTGEITETEKIEFDTWYNSFDDTYLHDVSDGSLDELKERLYNSILQKENIPVQKVRRLFPWVRIAAAASVLLMLSVGGWLLLHDKPVPDAAPGGNKAVLTLANGKKVILTNARNGLLAKESGMTIQKTADGRILYAANASGTSVKNAAELYNTIETPFGGQYWVVLADGSKVLLNAASSLKYPVAFTGNDREVELTGEAYFEVVHNSAKPFRVKTAGQVVEDIGTHFNINTYTDEPASQITLLEGGVKVTQQATNKTSVLTPGQQLLVNDNTFNIRKANVSQVMAWKDGLFVFDHTDLHTLMRQIGRWYDIQIVYEGDVKNEEYFGDVQRKYNLASVLNVLRTGGLHFRLDDPAAGSTQKRLVVMP